MPTITDLQIQRRNKQRVSVFLDGEFAFGIPLPAATGLKIGREMTAADLEDLQTRAVLEAAKQSAANFVSYRPRSVYEVRRNLRKKEYDDGIAEQVIAWLQAIDQLDDLKFAQYWVEQRETFKPRSAMALAAELRQKGVAREVIDEVLQDIDETASARVAADKRADRWLSLPEDQFRIKMGRYLKSRGFYYGVIKEVCDAILLEHAEQSE